MTIKETFQYFIHLIWPQCCPVCGRIGVSHCPECLAAATDPLPPFCLCCGGRFGASCCDDSVPCYAAAVHGGTARDFLLRLKYRGVRDLGVPVGMLMANVLPRVEADAIVPVPLHRGSDRGYNQCELIAEGISRVTGVPVLRDALEWRGRAGTQTGRSGLERRTLPLDSFCCGDSVRGLSVLLVDDVYTTGGTLRSARHAVKTAGGDAAAAFVWSRRLHSGENPDAFDEDLV